MCIRDSDYIFIFPMGLGLPGAALATAISLLLAAWFTDLRLKLKGQTFFKTVIYMPNLIMASAFAMLFFALFSDCLLYTSRCV